MNRINIVGSTLLIAAFCIVNAATANATTNLSALFPRLTTRFENAPKNKPLVNNLPVLIKWQDEGANDPEEQAFETVPNDDETGFESVNGMEPDSAQEGPPEESLGEEIGKMTKKTLKKFAMWGAVGGGVVAGMVGFGVALSIPSLWIAGAVIGIIGVIVGIALILGAFQAGADAISKAAKEIMPQNFGDK